MELVEILAAIRTGRDLIAWAIRQASLQAQNGEFTAEQLTQVGLEAGIADAQWDNAVAAAKARLNQG